MNDKPPRIEEVYDFERVPVNLWKYAPEVLLFRANEAVSKRVPTSIAIATYDGKKYWCLLHVSTSEYIEAAIEK